MVFKKAQWWPKSHDLGLLRRKFDVKARVSGGLARLRDVRADIGG